MEADKQSSPDCELHNLAIRVADLESFCKNMKEEMTILGEHYQIVHPRQEPPENVPPSVDRRNKVTDHTANSEDGTDINLGGSDCDDIGTLLNGNAKKITIINVDEEIIAQSENVNYTRAYLRSRIYVSLIDNYYHLFLMVISVEEGKVYKLDSYPNQVVMYSKDLLWS
ncbi:hypothetical protein PIB30_070240 [Stylosanthes scabra]|uniref:Uncharacterized protein n=1 Tax=Stylosanthes scabra TaxID=79078 RepID=A0ABU6RNB6_9FABA|nr:hypothetical protein [Stylosanthes scabra]